MRPIPKSVRFLAATAILLAGPAAYGSLTKPTTATKADLAVASGGTCWTFFTNDWTCTSSHNTCNADGDGTYTFWDYTDISFTQRMSASSGNSTYDSELLRCAFPWDCHFDGTCNSWFVPGGNCFGESTCCGAGMTTNYYNFTGKCP